MGLNRLIIVDGCSPLHANSYKLASGAEDILERAEEMITLHEAVSDMGCVVGMTSRERKGRNSPLSPESMAKQLIPLSFKNRVGLAFGPEKDGLTNEELSLCHLYAKIPSSQSFPSLNLAQAVVVVCYELFKCSGEASEETRELAPAEDLEKMFEHMEKTFIEIGFLDPNHPERIMRTLRELFGRSFLDEREVRILQGILRQIEWHLRRKHTFDSGG